MIGNLLKYLPLEYYYVKKCLRHFNSPAPHSEGTEKVDYTVYIWYNVSIKYRRCFYDRTTAEIDAKSIHGNI